MVSGFPAFWCWGMGTSVKWNASPSPRKQSKLICQTNNLPDLTQRMCTQAGIHTALIAGESRNRASQTIKTIPRVQLLLPQDSPHESAGPPANNLSGAGISSVVQAVGDLPYWMYTLGASQVGDPNPHLIPENKKGKPRW